MSFKVEQTLLVSEKTNNEDYIWYNQNTALIFDGSTNLGLYANLPDAYWYVQSFAKAFEECIKTEPCLLSALKNSIDAVAERFYEITSIDPTQTTNTSSASLSAVTVVEDRVDCYALGDCSSIVYFKDGTAPKLIRQNLVAQFDNVAIAEMVKIAKEKGIDVCETISLPEIRSILAANRKKMNAPDGYWILSFQKEAIDHMEKHSFPKDNVEGILMFTDGLNLMTDYFLQGVPKRPLADICTELQKIENDDCTWNKYPRFHTHDDVGAIYIKIED